MSPSGPRLALLVLLPACDRVFSLEQTPDAPPPVDAPPPQRAALVDDFEGALDPRWIRSLDNGDTCEITTDQAASGTHSLRCRTDDTSGSRASLAFTFVPTSTLRVRMSVRFANRPANWLTFLQTANVTENQTRLLVTSDFYNTPSRIDAWNYQTMQSIYATTTIALNTWYRVDFRTQISSTNGNVEVVVDDTDRAAIENIDTTDLPINQVNIGIALVTTPVESLTIYIDDLEISEQ